MLTAAQLPLSVAADMVGQRLFYQSADRTKHEKKRLSAPSMSVARWDSAGGCEPKDGLICPPNHPSPNKTSYPQVPHTPPPFSSQLSLMLINGQKLNVDRSPDQDGLVLP